MFLAHLKESVERIEISNYDPAVVKKELPIIKACIHHIDENSQIDEEVIQDLRKQLE